MADPHGPGRSVALLAAQSTTLGLTSAFLIIPTTGLFLQAYGSGGLPWAYLGVAALGAAGSPVLARSLARWSLPTVCIGILAALAALVGGAWAVLRSADTAWPAFALYVLFPTTIQLGFVIVGSQAGRLLNVRQMKALFPRVVVGFPLGFLIGGLSAGPLLSAVDRAADLLLLSVAAALAFLALVVATRRAHPAELTTVAAPDDHATGADAAPASRAGVASLLRHPFVFALLTYQLLSMLGTQLLEFLVYDRAAARYSGSKEISKFFSVFSVSLNAVDIVFLTLLAGFLVSRYGMRFGLVANSAAVLVFVAGALFSGATSSALSLGVFVLVCSARVGDISLTDGATRTAINTAYQALPETDRLTVQAFIEGFGVPAAIGLTGVLLLLADGLFHVGTMVVIGFTGVVAVAWTASGIAVYRRYQHALLETLRERALDPATLRADDEATLAVLDRLVDSDDERDARLCLEVLEEHPLLALRLEVMTGSRLPAIRAEALERLSVHDPEAARRRARDAVDDPVPAVRATALGVLAKSTDAGDVARAEELAALDSVPAVRLHALAGLVAAGRQPGDRLDAAVSDLVERAADPDARHAAVAALRMAPAAAEKPLLRLLADPDPSVAAAACAAAVANGSPVLLEAVVEALGDAARASGAAEALRDAGHRLAPLVDARLSAGGPTALSAGGPTAHRRAHGGAGAASLVRLVRSCRDLPSADATTLLATHALHPSRDVGLAVLTVLGPLAAGDDERVRAAVETVLRTDAALAGDVLQGLVLLGDDRRAASLRGALLDELALLQQRVSAALALRHDPAAVGRAAQWLTAPGTADHLAALALETLDVSLTPAEKGVALPVLQAPSDPARRLADLRRHVDVPTRTLDELLDDLARDRDGRWQRPWLAACAVHTAASMALPGLDRLVTAAWTAADEDDPDAAVVVETATWAAPGRRG